MNWWQEYWTDEKEDIYSEQDGEPIRDDKNDT